MSVLIIEDENKLVDILKRALRAEDFFVDTAFDGEEGFMKASTGRYELIILDLMLPKKDGVDVCRDLRKQGVHTPIIMLTARGTVHDRVVGLDVGADDYIVKPFGIEELLARMRAVMRRRKTVDPVVWKFSDIILDPQKHQAVRSGKILDLTPKEYNILEDLIRNKGQAISRRQLLDHAWGPDFKEKNRELNVHINYLRKKIDAGRVKPIIQTVRGVGYAIRD